MLYVLLAWTIVWAIGVVALLDPFLDWVARRATPGSFRSYLLAVVPVVLVLEAGIVVVGAIALAVGVEG
jgi:hypothetical protein